MKNALIELLKVEDIKKISVCEITKKANINRGTFYLHYVDICDLVDQIEDEVFNDLSNIVSKNIKHMETGEYYYPIIEVATYAKANKDFFKVITSENGDLNFEKKVKKAMMNIFDEYGEKIKREIPDVATRKAYTSFMISGSLGSFIAWINDDCAYPAAKIIRDLVNLFSRK